MNILQKTSVSDCGTYHLDAAGLPLYTGRFCEALAFHRVCGRLVAPVQQGSHAFHIDIDGMAIYESRFKRCFGFYDDLAAVTGSDGCYHIHESGSALYSQRYSFVGNYQESAVVVVDTLDQYFHLNVGGTPLYDERWSYCGDFRGGIAVVQSSNGLSSHIRKDGALLHGEWFTDLDVYHKGFARAKTVEGWCHIDKTGVPTGSYRFASVEPFYNGFARCETYGGGLLVINEAGEVIRHLRSSTQDKFAELSADMVGYWKTFAISAAINLGIFEKLPASLAQLANDCECDFEHLGRLMAALQELDLVSMQNRVYRVAEKGEYLHPNHAKSLADAAGEYAGDLLQRWGKLPDIIRGEKPSADIFLTVANNKDRVASHHRMLASYALHDYPSVVALLPIKKGDMILDAGGGTGTLAALTQAYFPDSTVTLGDLKSVIEESDFRNNIELDFFKPWPIKADHIILARVLHDWPDSDAITILKFAKEALLPGGTILLVESLLDEKSFGGALCDLHLLVVTGGKERSLNEFRGLAQRAGLNVDAVVKSPSIASLLTLKVGGYHG